MNDARHKLVVLDERVEGRVQEIRATRDWWPCRRGCARCCRHLAHPPELSLEEWVRVDEAVAALPDSIRAEVEERIDALLRQIAEKTVGKHVVCRYVRLTQNYPKLGQPTTGTLARKCSTANEPSTVKLSARPFLLNRGGCIISTAASDHLTSAFLGFATAIGADCRAIVGCL